MKTIFSTRPPVPIDALFLNEDIRTLELCRTLLKTVDPSNVCDDREVGRKSLWVVEKMLRTLQTHAEKKLRQEYLAPRKRKMNASK